MISNEKQIVVISGFMGFAMGTMLMMIVNLQANVDRRQTDKHDSTIKH